MAERRIRKAKAKTLLDFKKPVVAFVRPETFQVRAQDAVTSSAEKTKDMEVEAAVHQQVLATACATGTKASLLSRVVRVFV